MSSGSIAILGLGNVLYGDDAVGPWVIRQLEAFHRFPENVVIEDLGAPGIGLPTFVAGFDEVIFIDAVASSDPPGTIHLYSRSDVLRHAPGIRISPHDPSLRETILTVQLAEGREMSTTLVGIVPETIGPGIGMSASARDAVLLAAELVVDLLRRKGIDVKGHGSGALMTPWWEREGQTVSGER